jgi:S1/P1 Nuclease
MSSNNVRQLSNIATELLARFSRVGLQELDNVKTEAWAKESYEIATKIAYEGGNLRGTSRGTARGCREVRDADFLSRGYSARAKLIAERRIYLSAARLADALRGLF